MKKKMFLLLIGLFLLTGCNINSDVMEDIDIYTTTYPISYILNNLYGSHSTIYSIYPNGVNVKEYILSDKKINEYAKSDLFVFNSQDIEMDYAVNMININKNLKLIDVAYGMNYEYSIEELWLNPYNYLMLAKNAKDNLEEYINNPYLVNEINDNYEELQYNLSKLDANYKESISNANYDTIVTDNTLFKYLEKYGITVISLDENILTITVSENDTLGDIAKKYNVKASDILTYNNMTDENLKVGSTLNIPIKTIDTTDITKVKKLISENKIKYIYSDNTESNDTVMKLISDYNLELVTINTMYSVDGGITNTNEDYLSIMGDNLELLKKELNK